LHAYAIQFTLPSKNQVVNITAPLDPELKRVLKDLKKALE
jgi:hypothetical protein